MNILSESFLFKGVNSEEIKKLFKLYCPKTSVFKKGEIIYSPDKFENEVGIIIKGKCRVERMSDGGKSIPLNDLGPSDSFGIVAIFSGRDSFPTHVLSLTDTTIAFWGKADIQALICESNKIALNVISFMANRIDFLNDKIMTFSGHNVEQKLAKYIYDLYRERGTDSFTFNKDWFKCLNTKSVKSRGTV